MASSSSPNQNVVRLKPFQFIHVLDLNTNLTRVLCGPLTFTRSEHEQVVAGPDRMIIIPARHYCRIANPVIRTADKEVALDSYGNYKLKHGDTEIRFESEPFPLYPGEQLIGAVEPLKMVEANNALLIRALRDYTADGQARFAGQELLVRGPCTYIPSVNEEVVGPVRAIIVRQNQALRLRASRDMVDQSGIPRRAGEEWLYHSAGAYIPEVTEEMVRIIDALILTDKKALHVKARRNFESFGVERRAGESWLITAAHCEAYTPNVNEDIVGEVAITTLTNRQYCVLLNPVDKHGAPQLGQRRLITGEASFFLHPGEVIEGGAPQNIHVLGEEEALILRARSACVDQDGMERPPGSRWILRGPCDYVPDVQVDIVDARKCIPLDEAEGIYVRDLTTGSVRMVHGESHLLGANEVLWEKELPPIVETLLQQGAVRESAGQKARQEVGERDKTRVVTYRAPHNSAVQVYDYKAKKSRVIFGPELVMLGPDENFTVLSLSAGCPKMSNQQPALSLLLGPDFMQDQIIVETSDHAQLRLQLAYNWQFEVDKSSAAESAKIFSVPDFVGDCCKAVASRVRGAVALVTFEAFHKAASDIIARAVFGENANRLIFSANNLVLTNIDIQEVEPVDVKTRESLQRSVQLTIEITTKSQEAIARREAERKEQIARGQLDRQTIQAEAESEQARKSLIELKAKSLQAEHAGQAKAEAKARAAAEIIKWTAEVKQAELEAETVTIRASSELDELKQRHDSELTHQLALNEMEVDRAKRLAEIEAEKFAEIVQAIGPETIKSIARAGPEMQAKLLK
ncbi:MAG: colicin uptake protein, partial [archaeon]|nr:colicin uptake protein [archaeon]